VSAGTAKRVAAGLCVLLLVVIVSAEGGAGRASPTRDVEVIQTTQDLSQKLAHLPDLSFRSAAPPKGVPVINVNDRLQYQSFNGLGAAMTDTSAWLIEDELSPASARTLMANLFGRSGIRLGFLRVPIGASDFTRTGIPYSYDELPAGQSDPQLKDFSIAHDKPYVLPALRTALADNPGLVTLAVPWSAPSCMKANDSLTNVKHQGTLLPADYGIWAQYIVKFLQAYAAAGVPISEVAPQNEPEIPANYLGMEVPEAGEEQLVGSYLVPALRAAGLDQRIYGYDVGWGAKWPYADALATSSIARDLTGLAWHCYAGPPTVMSTVHDANPGLATIVDECSPGLVYFSVSESIIASLRNWASTVALWNLALDPSGGPVEPPNGGCPNCTGVVTIDEHTHAITYNRAYYQLGQVSDYIEPGAVRIASNNFVTYGYKPPAVHIATPGVDDVAFRNPDGSDVLFAYNSATAPVRFAVSWHGRSFLYTLPASGTVTFVWNQPR
jgi:glucosylceramidase